MAVTMGALVVVVIETGSDAVEVVVDTVWVAWAWVAAVAAATRIQHLTPRLRPRAPSTSTVLVIPGFTM